MNEQSNGAERQSFGRAVPENVALTHRTTTDAPALMPYLAEMWDRRDLGIVMPWMMFKTRNANNLAGRAWIVISPALNVLVYYLIFGILLDTSRGVPYLPSYLVVGVFMFGFIQGAITQGTGSILSNLALIRTLYFPRALMPFQAVMLQFYNFVAAMSVGIIALLLMGEYPRLSWVVFALLVVPLFGFCFGASLISARLNLIASDWGSVLPFIFRVLLFTSSVIIPVENRFVENPDALSWFALNPVFSFLAVARWALLDDYALRTTDLISVVAWPILVLVIGMPLFKSAERHYSGAMGE